MTSGSPIQPNRQIDSVTPIAAGDSTITEQISKLQRESREIEEVKAMIVEREEKLKRNAQEMEKKMQEVELEKVKMEDELKIWKRNCEVYQEELGQVQSDYRDLSEIMGIDRIELIERQAEVIHLKQSVSLAEADYAHAMREKTHEFDHLKKKIGDAEDAANQWQEKYQRYEARVQKFTQNTALFLREYPDIAKVVEEMARKAGFGLCFNQMYRKASAETMENGLNEIEDSENVMLATGKRPVANNKDLDDDDASRKKMKRVKDLSFPNMSSATESSYWSDNNSTTSSYVDRIALGESNGKEFKFEADMLRAISEDDVLCMSAVCALYRQETNQRSFGPPSAIRGFNLSDAIRGCALAKFLIDGDPQGKLRKSVKELQEYDPKGIDDCRRIAGYHMRQLFQIYQKEEDPFFCRSMI